MIARTLSVLLIAGTLTFAADKGARAVSRGGGGRTHIRLGTVTVGGGYSRFSRPFFGYPYYYYSPYRYGLYSMWSPWWDPWYYYPGVYPGLYPGSYLHSRGPGMGEVKLTAPKSAQVYLNGAYAGTARDLKTMWLEPGAYDLEVRPPSGEAYTRRIYVLSGKELKIDAMDGEARK